MVHLGIGDLKLLLPFFSLSDFKICHVQHTSGIQAFIHEVSHDL